MYLADIEVGSRLFALFKGDPGTGKSIQAGSFPGPIYWFDCDNRMRPVKLFHGQTRTDIEFDTYHRNYPKFVQKLEYLLNKNSYQTIVIDSLTALTDMIILQSIRSAGQEDRYKNVIGGVQIASIEDYNMESGALTQVMDAIRGLKSNVILTAHVIETSERDLKSKKVTVSRSLLTGGKKVAAKIPGYFDEAYHFYVLGNPAGGSRYMVTTTHSGDDWAKTALPIPSDLEVSNCKAYPDKYLYPQLKKYIDDYIAAQPPVARPAIVG